ncbi:ABC transporter permease [Streptacidiphilus sp. ASG 303]|uniref:ABC transporter permease n=1 Tax=Streptacidiphilus sp. ASG 303 TaxID=2896847 RepID=UPI001E55F96C|nr:ABC transporter permease [Streptacidiphilus sp. ASG 303]MCD0485138.1 ABC transporter permease [Streptacidiphilus sp. ASG 303]
MTTTVPVQHRSSAEPGPQPADVPWLRIAGARGRLEIRQFFREKGQVILTFSLPVVLLVLFSTIFSGSVGASGLKASQVYATGMLATGIMTSSFQTLALQVATERRNGALKRLRATPMPPVAYFAGKVVMVLVSSLCQAAVLIALGAAFFGLRLSHDPGHWLTFLWIYALGITACSLTGLAYSSLIKGDGGGPIVILPLMVLQFVSGVFVPFTELPARIQQISAFFPLKWLCQGMRSVFLPEGYRRLEPAGGWEHGRTALVLAAWVVAGLLLCLRTFSWKGRNDG